MRKTPNPFVNSYWITLCVLSFVCVQAQTVDTASARSLGITEVQSQAQTLDHVGEKPIVLTPSQWEGTGLNLADLLATQAGVQTRSFGGMGRFQAVSIRGVPANKVVVCIDGVPLNSQDG